MNVFIPLLISIASVGLLFLWLLFVRLREVTRTRQLKRHRSKGEGLCDLLNFAAVVSDGVVIGKNGSLIAGYQYEGIDQGSLPHSERDVISARLNAALVRLGNGWMVHFDAVRVPCNPYENQHSAYFPDRVSQAIDDERREFFSQPEAAFESKFVLCVSYLPPSRTVRKLTELIYDDNSKQTDPRVEAACTTRHFERELQSLENRLESCFKLRRLKSRAILTEDGRKVIFDDLLSHLQYCVTGIIQPIRLPRHAYLDAVLGGQEVHAGVLPKIGRHYLQVVAIDGFPNDAEPGLLTALGEMPIGYRWSTRFICLESWEALTHIEKFRKKWKQQVIPFLSQVLNLKTDNINEDAAAMVSDASSAAMNISGGVVSAGYYTATLLFFDEGRDKVEHYARQAEKAINNIGFTARIETINTMDAWLGSIPGHGVENVRKPLINTMNLADLLPVSSIWQGENKAPCPFYPKQSPPLARCLTTGQTAFNLNLHVDDVGNTFIAGPIGSGKSALLGFVASQLRRYPGMTLYVFDKGMSMFALCSATGGTHYNPAGDDDQLSFAPLQFLMKNSDRAWAASWIDQICGLNGLILSPDQRNKVTEAIKSMHERGHSSLTDFCSSIQDVKIREVLAEYTVGGSYGQLFDAEHDNLGLSTFSVFEVESLMGLPSKIGLPILLYLFRRITRSLGGQPAAIILDEAWLMLDNPVFREKIREWLKTMRKANCAVVMATQSLSDACNSEIVDIIHESCATKIFLPNCAARDAASGSLYQKFGLNDREVDLIASSTPKRDYYLRTEAHKRVFDLALGPLALAFVGVSDKESVAQVKRCQQEFGDDWVDEHLRRRGLSLGSTQQNGEKVLCNS
jgi:type IV secretion/conjugal transfer VirB4 family ATPase